MRIITGSARGKKLITLEGDNTRPTGERVKEAVFSMIQYDIEGRDVLDLFGGSGQLALEALSRGAAKAVILDNSPDAISVIKTNAKSTGLFDKCRISAMEYDAFLKRSAGREAFDIIFLDPPYMSDFLCNSLRLIADGKIAKPHALIVCESPGDDVFGGDRKLSELYDVIKSSKYGKAWITILTPTCNKNEII